MLTRKKRSIIKQERRALWTNNIMTGTQSFVSFAPNSSHKIFTSTKQLKEKVTYTTSHVGKIGVKPYPQFPTKPLFLNGALL